MARRVLWFLDGCVNAMWERIGQAPVSSPMPPAEARVKHPLTLLSCTLILASGSAAVATEQLPYAVQKPYDGFELRRYDPYLVAQTEVTGPFEKVGDAAFRLLFGYISGDNRRREEIAMTAPVTQAPAGGEKIAMTAPVIQTPAGSGTYTFSFVMPSHYTLDTLPEPTDPRVTLRQMPGQLVAARRFSGTWGEENYRSNEKALLEAVAAAGLKPVGVPSYARYNSPFMPWFLRRNEAMVEVAEAP